ncbi:hypothetical protein AVEN_36657-1, partial [Araneus ventricosus]
VETDGAGCLTEVVRADASERFNWKTFRKVVFLMPLRQGYVKPQRRSTRCLTPDFGKRSQRYLHHPTLRELQSTTRRHIVIERRATEMRSDCFVG